MMLVELETGKSESANQMIVLLEELAEAHASCFLHQVGIEVV